MPVGQLGSLNFANLVTCGHSFWDKLKSVGGFKLPKNYSQQVFLLDGYQRLSLSLPYPIL